MWASLQKIGNSISNYLDEHYFWKNFLIFLGISLAVSAAALATIATLGLAAPALGVSLAALVSAAGSATGLTIIASGTLLTGSVIGACIKTFLDWVHKIPFPNGGLVKHMQNLDLDVPENGTCAGLATVGVVYMLNNNLSAFNTITKEIYGIEIGSKDIEKHRDFLEKVSCYQKNQSGKVLSEQLKQDGVVFFKNKCFTGIYTEAELIKYFDSLKSVILDSQPGEACSLALCLSNHNHRISVFYSQVKNEWQLIDANNFKVKYFSLSKDVARKVLKAFSKNECTAMVTSVFCLKKNEGEVANMIVGWERHADYKVIHKVSKRKAIQMDSSHTSWLHMAAKMGKASTVGKLCEKSAFLDQKNDMKISPITCAISSKDAQVVLMLIEAGAAIDIDTAILMVVAFASEMKSAMKWSSHEDTERSDIGTVFAGSWVLAKLHDNQCWQNVKLSSFQQQCLDVTGAVKDVYVELRKDIAISSRL